MSEPTKPEQDAEMLAIDLGLDPPPFADVAMIAAALRLAEMGMGVTFALALRNATRRADEETSDEHDPMPCYSVEAMLTAPIETWARVILETVRAAKAQEKE